MNATQFTCLERHSHNEKILFYILGLVQNGYTVAHFALFY